MQPEQTTTEKLLLFKLRDKFSDTAWEERGLNPSGSDMCKRLQEAFNALAERLIIAVDKQYSRRQLKSVLKAGLGSFNEFHYDTEEKEFICDLFQELATIVEVDIRNSLHFWLYGPALATLVKILDVLKIMKPGRIIKTLQHPCSGCSTPLETHILRKKIGTPETEWLVAKCKKCQELSLLSVGSDVAEFRYGNYVCVESLHMDDYTYEQALTRVEQIKHFRK